MSELFVTDMKKIASFDIFDTCVIRKCGIPEKIWDIMSDSLFSKEDVQSKITFKTQRKYAERKANQISPYPNLNQIYDTIDVSQWNLCKKDIIQLEESVEEKQFILNVHILPIIEKYRKDGYEICFISDMYLSSFFLKGVLKKFKLCNDNDSIYVSCECKATKNDGTLYDYIRNERKVKYKNWVHFGDNKISDFQVPQKKGIQAYWYTYTNFTEHEKNWLRNASFYNHKNEIELYAGLTRAVRLAQPKDSKTTLAADLVAPLYIPYVYFTLVESQQRKINQIYFLARDGHILFQIAKQFQSIFPDISLHYLKISRRAIYPCYFYDGSYEEFLWILKRADGHEIGSALFHIGIDWDQLPDSKHVRFHKEQLLNSESIAELADYLSRNFCKEIVKKAGSSRNNLLAYLNQENFLQAPHKAIVDLGWEGSVRICLNKILKKENFSQTYAFYWGYSNRVIHSKNNNVSFFRYEDSRNQPHAAEVMEHYVSANSSGSAMEYKRINNSVIPIETKQRDCLTEIQLINEGISCQIAKEYLSTINNKDANRDIFLCCGYRTLNDTLEFPNSDEAKIFSLIKADDFEKTYYIAEKLRFKDFITLFIWGHTFYPKWKEAAMSLTLKKKAKLVMKFAEITSSSKFMEIIRWVLKKISRCFL